MKSKLLKRIGTVSAFLMAASIMFVENTALNVFADEVADNGYYYADDFYYDVVNGKASLEIYEGTATELTIPLSIGGYNVNRIGHFAFSDNTTLRKVTIPEGITEIGRSAFEDCTELESVNVPSTVKYLSGDIFRNCDKLVECDNKSGEISIRMFEDCDSLENVNLENIHTIYSYAFSGCDSIKSVTIPACVTTLDSNIFSKCSNLKEITIQNNVIGFDMFGDCISLESVTIPENVTYVDEYAFSGCKNLKNVVIKNNMIGSNMFAVCTSLKSIEISDSVESIDTSAFSGCTNLESVSIGKNVKKIDKYIFQGCSKLTNVTLNNNFIGERMFERCDGIRGIVIPENITEIHNYAFSNCSNLRKVTIPRTVTKIGKNIFDLSDVVIYGYAGSYAEEYAKENDIPFVQISSLELTTQPVDFVGEFGDTATFTVEANGENLTYQWYQNTGDGWVAIDTDAGRSNSISIRFTGDKLESKYYCTVSDGTNTVDSDIAFIKYAAVLAIKSQPKDFVGRIGETATFTVRATGVTHFQWYQNTGSGWVAINTDSGKRNFINIPITDENIGFQYYCAVSDGTDTITSDVVSIKLDESLAITTHPDDFVGAIGDTAKFTVEAIGAKTYQWYQNTGSGWVAINTSAGRSKSISIPVVQFRVGFMYYCEVSDGTKTLNSAAVYIRLDEDFAITGQPVDYVGEIGDTAKFTVEATGATSYQWYQNTGNGWVAINTSAGRSKSISIPVVQFRVGFKYYCAVSDGINTINSDVATIKLDEVLAITGQPVDYVGEIGDTAKFTVEATGATSYQWYQDTGSGWVAINTSAGRNKSINIAVTSARVGFKYYCAVSDGTSIINSNVATIKLDEVLAITGQPEDYVGTIGGNATFTIETTGATSYQWYQNTGSGWVAINTNAGRNKSISIPITAARVGFQYRCEVSDGTSTITSEVAEILI